MVCQLYDWFHWNCKLNVWWAYAACLNSSHTHKHTNIWTHMHHQIFHMNHNTVERILPIFFAHILCAGCLHTTHTSVIITLFKCNFILTTLDWCYVFLHVASLLLLLLVFCTKGVRTLYLSANWVRDLIFRSHTPIFFLHLFAVLLFFHTLTHSLDHKQRLHSKWVLMPMTTSQYNENEEKKPTAPRSLNYECQ